MLTLRRSFVPASLALGAILLAVPGSADPSAVQTITLQHTVPGDIVKSLHWDSAAGLPAGVARIQTLPAQNALAVAGTPAGIARVREIVKIVDIEPRQVQVKFAFVPASATGLKPTDLNFKLDSGLNPEAVSALRNQVVFQELSVLYPSCPSAAQLFQALTRRGVAIEGPMLTTANNVNASMDFGSGAYIEYPFSVNPQINSDNSVTLLLKPLYPVGISSYPVSVRYTVKNGETMAYLMPPAVIGGDSLLLFATPTILPSK